VEDPVVLKEKHLKFCVMQDGEYRHIIAFNWACRVQELSCGRRWMFLSILILTTIAARPALNYN